MRVLGVTERWSKLKKPRWPTFRLQRRDKDWQVGEVVQVVYKPRRKGGGEFLGIAVIVKKELRHFWNTVLEGKSITKQEAQEDGFSGQIEMKAWFIKAHGARVRQEPLNKLTLRWVDGKTPA